jgi:hypothetical protein
MKLVNRCAVWGCSVVLLLSYTNTSSLDLEGSWHSREQRRADILGCIQLEKEGDP